jgi:hydrogenase expression/formation protein HypC
MCVAAPGRVVKIFQENGVLMGELDFGGISKSVCLAHVPDIKVDQYAMVHAGFALEIIDETEVAQFHELWQQVMEAKR